MPVNSGSEWADSALVSTHVTESDATEAERRRSQRTPHIVEAWISSPTATDPKDREEVRSVNLSRHGVAFEHRIDLPLGTFHVIDFTLAEQRLHTEVRIMYCRSMGDGTFEIGAEFS
jgi:hypothetical protein